MVLLRPPPSPYPLPQPLGERVGWGVNIEVSPATMNHPLPKQFSKEFMVPLTEGGARSEEALAARGATRRTTRLPAGKVSRTSPDQICPDNESSASGAATRGRVPPASRTACARNPHPLRG